MIDINLNSIEFLHSINKKVYTDRTEQLLMGLGQKKRTGLSKKVAYGLTGSGKPGTPDNIFTGGNVTKRWFDLKKQYNHPWDPIGELIQNAVIAVEELEEENYQKIDADQPHIIIKIDHKEKKFTVTDLGKGFPDKKYFSLQETTRLEKLGEEIKSGMGLGLSSTLARSSNFKCTTRREENGKTFQIEFKGVCEKIISEGQKELDGGKPDLKLGDKKFKEVD